MWSANEFFYGTGGSSPRPDVLIPDSPPRGYTYLQEPGPAYSSSSSSSSGYYYPEDSHHRGALQPHPYQQLLRPTTGAMSAASPALQAPRAYAGAAPLIGYHDQQTTAGFAARPDLHRPVADYYGGGAAPAVQPVPTYDPAHQYHNSQMLPHSGYYANAAHSLLPHGGTYANTAQPLLSHSGTYLDASQPSFHHGSSSPQQTVELKVPFCCQACNDRIKDALIGVEGVRGVAMDLDRQVVTIVGHVNSAHALQLVDAVQRTSAHHSPGTERMMY